MGRISTSFVLLTSLIAACAACTAPNPATGNQAAGATRAPAVTSPVATVPATPTAPATRPPHRHRRPARHRPAAAQPVPYAVGCQPAALRLALGPRLSEKTQQETTLLTLTNISAAGCDLRGYPGVALLDAAGRALPFLVRWGGDQMLTASAPVLVPLPPGGIADLGINKNACVGHSYRAARYLQVIPPNDYLALPLLRLPYYGLDYCPAGDPGHTVDVSPVEPIQRGVLSLH